MGLGVGFAAARAEDIPPAIDLFWDSIFGPWIARVLGHVTGALVTLQAVEAVHAFKLVLRVMLNVYSV